MIRKTNIVTGKKAYIIPHASIREELRCGAILVTSPNSGTVPDGQYNPEELDKDPAKRRNFNFYSPYSDDNNW